MLLVVLLLPPLCPVQIANGRVSQCPSKSQGRPDGEQVEGNNGIIQKEGGGTMTATTMATTMATTTLTRTLTTTATTKDQRCHGQCRKWLQPPAFVKSPWPRRQRPLLRWRPHCCCPPNPKRGVAAQQEGGGKPGCWAT
jgi:hypothetical protein